MSNIIDIKDLSYVYLPGTPYEQQALKDINMVLNQGELLGLFGGNGSGKSTLAKLLNGLLYPSRGKVRVCGIDTSIKELRNELWKKVGLVFQYPEQQIFEANIYDEVAYGPRNLGLKEAEVKSRVYQALEKVGLLPETLVNLSPVKLSGGVRRRIAIAGVLALEPEILIMVVKCCTGILILFKGSNRYSKPADNFMGVVVIKRRMEPRNNITRRSKLIKPMLKPSRVTLRAPN
jgi:energy-coupling factor transport system ATP-binding protein